MNAGWFDYMAKRPPREESCGEVNDLRYELGRRCAAVYVSMGYKRVVLICTDTYLPPVGSKQRRMFDVLCTAESHV